ncbi:MAG TPA: GIY-YIG nuclease family protein [Candidatus Absconditabacterales bacterium]|nr:GIY-YIG nuclease family protein [Candidatus Absconditabacterales bacterium]
MVVYKITCEKDGRSYIGATINSHHRRLEHFNHLRKNRHHNIFLQRAFNKYGEESFTYEILERFKDLEKMWNREEELVNTLPNLYNMMPGGIRGPRMYGKDNPKFGKPISEQQRRLQSEAMSGENHPQFGKSYYNNGEQQVVLSKQEVEKYLKQGWKKGRLDTRGQNNPMHTHNIDFSGINNPNVKHYKDFEKIEDLRSKKKTWNEIAKELGKKSPEALRKSYTNFKKLK